MNLKFLVFFYHFNAKQYDYIIVGGGSAGGVVAYELASKGYRTLLIEAGPEHKSGNITTPILHGKASEDPKISFEYFVKLYKNSTLRQNVFYPRVGGLGGCSLHNAMISIYPNSLDFENMVKHTGNQLFSEPEMRRIFKEMEVHNYPLFSKSGDHGSTQDKDGWYPISYINLLRQISLDPKLLNALLTIKGNPFHDSNGHYFGKLGADVEGRVFLPMNIDKNFERGNFQARILSAKENYGLEIWTDTLVTKIILDENNKAEGVQYRKGKYLYKASPLNNASSDYKDEIVYAKKEIILSAGTFNTPQLLMLSGIGPKEKLEKLNIPTKVNLKGVGENLQDRYEISLVNKFDSDFSLLKKCKFIADPKLDTCYAQYLNYKTGPYISNGILSAFIRKSVNSPNQADLFTLNIPTRFNGYFKGYSQELVDHKNEFSQTVLKARSGNKGGTVELISNDPTMTPEINFNYFSNDPSDNNEDLIALTAYLKHLRGRFSKTILFPYKEVFPGEHVVSDKDFKTYIRENAWGHHACCTAKIGNDDKAVLDGKFKVRGVKNLRVVDMSVFPEIPGFFPVLYLQMVATQVARIIASEN